jgi:transposase
VGAVRVVRETGKSIAQVAKDLGINAGTLANWVQMDRLAREQNTGSGELTGSAREELASCASSGCSGPRSALSWRWSALRFGRAWKGMTARDAGVSEGSCYQP